MKDYIIINWIKPIKTCEALVIFLINRKQYIMLLFCPSWSCTIICWINRFTSLCKNLFTWVFSRSFSCASFSMLNDPGGTVKHWKWCTWHRKASAKNSNKLNKFLHSEVNLLIQYSFHNVMTSNKLILFALDIVNFCFIQNF